jgi:ABC-type phosphate transport system auxiliary subunit
MIRSATATVQLSRAQLEAALEQLAERIAQLNDTISNAYRAAAVGDLPRIQRELATARVELEALAKSHERACRAHETR